MNKKILIACEESQAITIEFRKLGFECYSCDILDCSGGHPEWHIKGDALEEAYSGKYALMVAHPPCTYLSNAGNRALHKNGEIDQERLAKGFEAKEFFMKLLEAPIAHICVENPVSNSIYKMPKYDQIIYPWQHGDPFSKRTCLWLRNLPKLTPTNIVEGVSTKVATWYNSGGNDRQSRRSKTFPGIAKAIATQWSLVL